MKTSRGSSSQNTSPQNGSSQVSAPQNGTSQPIVTKSVRSTNSSVKAAAARAQASTPRGATGSPVSGTRLGSSRGASGHANMFSKTELDILKILNERKRSNPGLVMEVHSISSQSGVRDNDEVLRALYTLEGKSLVRPEPEGDFTSQFWQITDNGEKAVKILHS